MTHEDLLPLAATIEQLQCVQRAIRDLVDDAEQAAETTRYSCEIHAKPRNGDSDYNPANTHALPVKVVMHGLVAMESELRNMLQHAGITVEPILAAKANA